MAVILTMVKSRICSCLACVYRDMDARGRFGEYERCIRVVRGDIRQLCSQVKKMLTSSYLRTGVRK